MHIHKQNTHINHVIHDGIENAVQNYFNTFDSISSMVGYHGGNPHCKEIILIIMYLYAFRKDIRRMSPFLFHKHCVHLSTKNMVTPNYVIPFPPSFGASGWSKLDTLEQPDGQCQE